jgi:periplasmic protein CpxP/Spy
MQTQPTPKRSRAKLAALIAIPLIIAGGALAFAHQKSGGHHGPMSEQRIDMHLEHLAAMLTKVGASDAQKSQIDGIMRAAFANLQSVRDEHHKAFGQFHELIMAPSLDRAKMESLRADQIRALDAASKNVVTAFGDAAEVLNPEQRAAFADLMRKHHGG